MPDDRAGPLLDIRAAPQRRALRREDTRLSGDPGRCWDWGFGGDGAGDGVLQRAWGSGFALGIWRLAAVVALGREKPVASPFFARAWAVDLSDGFVDGSRAELVSGNRWV